MSFFFWQTIHTFPETYRTNISLSLLLPFCPI